MKAFRRYQIRHVYREASSVADSLAHLGRDRGRELECFEHPPSQVSMNALTDNLGLGSTWH